MSEPSDRKREWTFYLDDMVAFGEKVSAYSQGLDQQTFVGNSIVYDATIRNLELIGEAATRIPDDVRLANPQIPWRLIIATRNRLIHGYLGIDDDTVWSIIRDDLPSLLKSLRGMRENLPSPRP
ncbi:MULTISPECIES: HepT-like ribonuclease domain-containing protein [Thiorhodovibrio]|uniref:HepT-like ribonuclease domain-containing protein n=1 Tax=Thiorhodovibrio TaxID=61593 RepID=UPI0019149E08|nr:MULTISPECIES: DUF86 domain-containing protein [Thiorhodovibrio]MBK5967929.1 nucleotidyltransferase [Thiorhodovibrio winogradskyi]WPL13130.1 hypothetical protein Thiosp_02922 [Thiorhodovibrio litoralis]